MLPSHGVSSSALCFLLLFLEMHRFGFNSDALCIIQWERCQEGPNPREFLVQFVQFYRVCHRCYSARCSGVIRSQSAFPCAPAEPGGASGCRVGLRRASSSVVSGSESSVPGGAALTWAPTVLITRTGLIWKSRCCLANWIGIQISLKFQRGQCLVSNLTEGSIAPQNKCNSSLYLAFNVKI